MTTASTALAPTEEPAAEVPASTRARSRRPRSASLIASGIVLGLVGLVGLLGRWIVPGSPNATDAAAALSPPGSGHVLGTDDLGRNVLVRTLAGAEVTVQVVLIGVGVALILGTLIGLIAGYVAGWVDVVLMRAVDGLLAFPILVLALAVVAATGAGLRNSLIAIAVVTTPRIARVVRGEVLSLRTREYVQAAQIVGVPTRTILRRHIFAHLAGTLAVFTAVAASAAIVAEASLSFLGLGVQPPTASWGSMIKSGLDNLEVAWWMSVFPGLALVLTVAALNLLADGLRDRLDTGTGRSS